MFSTLSRAIIIYAVVIVSVRLMGKRQIGDLQPSDLVITILISEVAAIPMQDNNLPLVNSILAVLLLSSVEVIVSFISMKSMRLRRAIDGGAVNVINDGNVNVGQLRRLRYTVDDLMSKLRMKDVFNLDDVEYAFVETNGELSVMLKPGKRTVTADVLGGSELQAGMPCVVISDGCIVEKDFGICGMTHEKLGSVLNSAGLSARDILLMTYCSDGRVTVVDNAEGVAQIRAVTVVAELEGEDDI